MNAARDVAHFKTADRDVIQQLAQLEWLIQTDLGCRGIHRLPEDNLCTRTQGNFARAVQFLAQHPGCSVGIATGFFIPTANPPAPENDGPPGALFLARGLNLLGYPVMLISDSYGIRLLELGFQLYADQLRKCDLVEFPLQLSALDVSQGKNHPLPPSAAITNYVRSFFSHYDHLQSLIAIERVGPSHTLESFLRQRLSPNHGDLDRFISQGPGELQGEPLTMNGIPIGQYTAPIHALFEYSAEAGRPIFTIGIGDGGNEIGMGSIPWPVIKANIAAAHAGKFACRVATDATIVAGVSNWAGYALIAGLCLCLDRVDDFLLLLDEVEETKLIELYYQSGSAVDGKLGYPAMSIDGIPWEIHRKLYELMKAIIANR